MNVAHGKISIIKDEAIMQVLEARVLTCAENVAA